jgi:hypothetical protein
MANINQNFTSTKATRVSPYRNFAMIRIHFPAGETLSKKVDVGNTDLLTLTASMSESVGLNCLTGTNDKGDRYIISIGKFGTQRSSGWIYLINGDEEPYMAPADRFFLKDQDQVDWWLK